MVDDVSGPSPGLPPLQAIPPDLATLAGYEARARDHLPDRTWRHIQEGCGADRTLRRNRTVFDEWGLLPSAMTDLREASTAIDLLGRRHASPILLAPVAYHRLAHPEGEVATMRAAAALDAGMVVSTLSSIPLEDIARAREQACGELGAATSPLWFQLYLQPDRADSLALVRRAEQAGYEAIVLTIDAAIKRSSFILPTDVDAANLRGMARALHTATAGGRILFGTPLAAAAPRWGDLAWLRETTRLPILLKGMIAGDDIRRALSIGVDGIILSNHGGRVLDVLPSAIDLLPTAIEGIGGRVPVLVDGGIRTGADIAAALALGADAVLVGRPQLHALAVAGMIGVAHMLHILRTELEMVMAQLGCASVAALRQDRTFRLRGPDPRP